MKYLIILLFLFFGCSKTENSQDPETPKAEDKCCNKKLSATPKAPATPTTPQAPTTPATPPVPATPQTPATSNSLKLSKPTTSQASAKKSVDDYLQMLCYLLYVGTLCKHHQEDNCEEILLHINKVSADAQNNLTESEFMELGLKVSQGAADIEGRSEPSVNERLEVVNEILQNMGCRTGNWDSTRQAVVKITGPL